MAYLNIFIGLGGTGVEVINDLLKIINRYPFADNKYKCFVLDSAELDKNSFRTIYKQKDEIYINLGGFNSSKDTIDKIKKQYSESNITDIFGKDDYLANHNVSSQGGAWENRKLGFLIFINYLLTSDNDVFERIDDYLQRESGIGNTITGINFFIVNSLAGGTGSGLFFPFLSFLKSTIDKSFLMRRPNFPVQYYSFLALPDFLAKGSRKPSAYKEIIYEANAYEALLELKMLMTKKINWQVKLSKTKEFDFSKGGTDFIRSFFIFNDVNIKGCSIPTQGLSDLDLYKPNFQELAWCLYLLGCADDSYWGDVGNSLKKFVGIGVLPIEFPAITLIDNISRNLFKKTPNVYGDFFNKSFQELEADLPTFNPSFKNYLIEAKNNFNKQLSKYKQELSLTPIEALKSKEPLIAKHDSNYYLKKFKAELNEKVMDLLNKNYTIKDIYYFLKFFKETIKSEDQNKNTVYKDHYQRLKLLEDQIKKDKTEILGSKKEKDLKAKQANLFAKVFDKDHLNEYLNLLENISLELQRKMDYFEKLRDVFTSDSKVSSYEIFDDYFNFPPPFSRIQYDLSQTEKYQFEILKGVLKDSGFKDTIKADVDIIEKQLLKNIWIDFSKEKFNAFIIEDYKKRFETSFEELHSTIDAELSDTIYEMWYDYIRSFFTLKYKSVVSKYNDIPSYISKGDVEHLNLCYPYISLNTSKKDIAHSSIFLSPDILQGIKIQKQFTPPLPSKPYRNLRTESLVMISTLKGDIDFEDLELSALANNYNIKVNEDQNNSKEDPTNRRYVFIDPRFGENK